MSYNKKTGMYEGYVYLITNKVNNKKYVGVTTSTIKHRMSQHFSKQNNNKNKPVIKCAIEKYGRENFKVEQLNKIIASNKADLKNKLSLEERFYIKLYQTLVSEYGYNVVKGGYDCEREGIKLDAYTYDGTFIKVFDSFKEAMIVYNIDLDTIKKMCNGGAKRTSKKKNIIFRYHGVPFDSVKECNDYKRSKKVYQYDDTGKYLNDYCDFATAAECVIGKKNSSGISHAVKEKEKYYGFYWSLKKYNQLPQTEMKERFKVAVDQYNFNGEYVNSYDSYSDALIACGKPLNFNSEIRNCCIGKSQHALGYIWRFRGHSIDEFPWNNLKNIISEIDQYDFYGNYINTYKGTSDILKILGKSKDYGSHILDCCKGKKLYALGYVWRFHDHPFNEYRTIDKHCKPLNCYTLDGNFVKSYVSGSEIKEELGYNPSNIYMCANKKYEQAYGYKWFYTYDENQPDKTKIVSYDNITLLDIEILNGNKLK